MAVSGGSDDHRRWSSVLWQPWLWQVGDERRVSDLLVSCPAVDADSGVRQIVAFRIVDDACVSPTVHGQCALCSLGGNNE